jgi:hypothetical protein
MHVTPSPSSEEIWSQQWSLLRQQMTLFFSRYTVSINRKTIFQAAVKTLFQQSFSIPLPASIDMRAVYENNIVRSIRRQLQNEQWILRRTADGNNVFYLGRTNEFEAQANDYLQTSTSYEKIDAYDEKSIDVVLQGMRQNRRISEQHLKWMQVKKTDVRLPRLYFLPDPQPNGSITLQPTMASFSRSPIQPLSQYLYELLRPLYDSHTQSTTLLNGADMIERLIRHCDYILLPKTRFVTIELRNFYMQMSHDRIIEALGRFLTSVLTGGRHQSLSIETIQQLAALVLRNNIFTYRGHIYRHVAGSPRSSPLTRTLGDIYLWDWQNSLLSRIHANEDFYGRYALAIEMSTLIVVLSSSYYDRVLLTWSPPTARLHSLLEELDQKNADIHMVYSIGYKVHFLGASIENRRSDLYTCVYHDPNVAPFLLPYVIGHPRLSYRQWFQWALRRAVRFSMAMEDFDAERRTIELTLLANGYSLECVTADLKTFFAQYFADSLQYYLDRPVFEGLRERLLTSINLERQYRKQQQQWRLNHQWIHLHYLYDWGPRCTFNRQFKQLWSDLIRQDPAFVDTDLKLKLSSVHCHPLNALLTQEAI